MIFPGYGGVGLRIHEERHFLEVGVLLGRIHSAAPKESDLGRTILLGGKCAVRCIRISGAGKSRSGESTADGQDTEGFGESFHCILFVWVSFQPFGSFVVKLPGTLVNARKHAKPLKKLNFFSVMRKGGGFFHHLSCW